MTMTATIINVTPHPITFKNDDGSEFTVPPCGKLVNASISEHVVTTLPDGTELVRPSFARDPASVAVLDELERDHPGAIIAGSIVAAQAYPGRVVAMTPSPGYERVPVEQKRMNPKRFSVYAVRAGGYSFERGTCETCRSWERTASGRWKCVAYTHKEGCITEGRKNNRADDYGPADWFVEIEHLRDVISKLDVEKGVEPSS